MSTIHRYNPAIHHRQSIRLKGYDYSQPGTYFITVCTQNRQCLFGEIVDEKMIMTDAGKIVHQCWMDIPMHFLNAQMDEFVVMPNHVHGIIVLRVGANNYSPLRNYNGYSPLRNCNGTSKTIGSIVRGFKIGVTKWLRTHNGRHKLWQRDYWEHIVRDEEELFRIRQYIKNNPLNWKRDKLNNDSNC